MFNWLKSKVSADNSPAQSSNSDNFNPEQLLEQCKQWHDAKQYDQIIDALTALSENQRTPELDCELARAFVKKSQGEDRTLIAQALGLLMAHQEQYANDSQWNYRVACCFFWLELSWRAFPYFKKAAELNPQHAPTQERLNNCYMDLSAPRFNQYFMELVTDKWQHFSDLESFWRIACANKGPSAALLEEMQNQCSEIFAPFEVHTYINYNPKAKDKNYKFRLIFDLSNSLEFLIPLVYLVEQAPAELKQHWQIDLGQAPQDTPVLASSQRDKSAPTHYQEINRQDLQLKIAALNQQADAEDGAAADAADTAADAESSAQQLNAKYTLVIHHPAMAALKQAVADADPNNEEACELAGSNLSEFYEGCLALVRQNVGEVVCCHAFNQIGMMPDSANFNDFPGEAYSLEHLASKLTEQGYNLNMSAQDLIEARRYNYQNEVELPDDGSKLGWRVDIFKGYTCYPELCEQYAHGDDSLSNDLYLQHLSAGFFAFKLKPHLSSDPFALDAERDVVRKALLEIIGKIEGVKLIGEAYGAQYDYIDVLCMTDYINLFTPVIELTQKHPEYFESLDFVPFRPGFGITFF